MRGGLEKSRGTSSVHLGLFIFSSRYFFKRTRLLPFSRRDSFCLSLLSDAERGAGCWRLSHLRCAPERRLVHLGLGCPPLLVPPSRSFFSSQAPGCRGPDGRFPGTRAPPCCCLSTRPSAPEPCFRPQPRPRGLLPPRGPLLPAPPGVLLRRLRATGVLRLLSLFLLSVPHRPPSSPLGRSSLALAGDPVTARGPQA